MPKAKEGVSVSSLEEGDSSLLVYAYVALGAYLGLGIAVYHLKFGWSLVDTLYVSAKSVLAKLSSHEITAAFQFTVVTMTTGIARLRFARSIRSLAGLTFALCAWNPTISRLW